jgi:hypothetical protein
MNKEMKKELLEIAKTNGFTKDEYFKFVIYVDQKIDDYCRTTVFDRTGVNPDEDNDCYDIVIK